MKRMAFARTGLFAGCLLLFSSLAVQAAKPVALAQTQRQDPLGLMGAQAGNEADYSSTGCFIGTIGSMVNDGTVNYLLSNNHVFARSRGNTPPAPEKILHVAAYLCDPSALHVGTLSAWVPLDFSGSNYADAALAEITDAVVPGVNGDDQVGHMADDGSVAYYVSNSLVPADSNLLGDPVQKTGRTTGLTQGVVSSIGVNVSVGYEGGSAYFVDQIVFSGSKGKFSDSGDSGSLIVTSTGTGVEAPVALLFAGSNTATIGNPIGLVISELEAELGGNTTLSFGYSGTPAAITAAEPPTSGGGGGGGGGGGHRSVPALENASDRHQLARPRGLEFEARGNVTENLEGIGALTLLETEVTKSTDASTIGKRPQAAPQYYGSLWANYGIDFGFLDGLSLGAGLRFVGSSYADDANTVKADGYTLVDAALNYDLEQFSPALAGAELTLNANNLLDTDYYASCTSGFYCQYGDGLQLLAGLRYKW